MRTVYFDDIETKLRFAEGQHGGTQLFPLIRRFENHLTYEIHLIDPLLKFTRVHVKLEDRRLLLFGKHSIMAYSHPSAHANSERIRFAHSIDLPHSINLKFINQHFVNGLMIIQFEKIKNLNYEK